MAKENLGTFKAFIAARPKVVPIEVKLGDKKDDRTAAKIDETQAEINRQLGCSAETFAKYGAEAK
jgi:hypothetical protein